MAEWTVDTLHDEICIQAEFASVDEQGLLHLADAEKNRVAVFRDWNHVYLTDVYRPDE